MSKKIIISAVSLTLAIALVFVFSSCGKSKDVYTDPQTGKSYILVTDENGEKVRSDDGELVVYVTEKNGKIAKDENGEPKTEVHGFIGQIKTGNTVEDYAYTVVLPDGWKTTNKKGYFENNSLKATATIDIAESTYSDYYSKSYAIYESIKEAADSGEADYAVTWSEDCEIPGADTKGVLMTLSGESLMRYFYFFENNGNVYKISIDFEAQSDNNKKTVDGFMGSITYKQYTYYPDVTSAPTTEAGTN